MKLDTPYQLYRQIAYGAKWGFWRDIAERDVAERSEIRLRERLLRANTPALGIGTQGGWHPSKANFPAGQRPELVLILWDVGRIVPHALTRRLAEFTAPCLVFLLFYWV